MDHDPELLVQRFLDGELDRAGRRALLDRLGRDAALRERLLADEAMLEAVAGLPRLAPSDDFVARTLVRLADTPAQPPEPVARNAARPRRAPRWLQVAAAASLLVAAGYWAGRTATPPAAPPGLVGLAEAPVEQVVVRLVLVEPTARTVAIVGDFNGWDPMRSPLERLNQGVWTATLELPPGRYHYQFLVDGERWIADPLAQETTFDGFGAQNSVLDVGA